jgi:hypothetical protein
MKLIRIILLVLLLAACAPRAGNSPAGSSIPPLTEDEVRNASLSLTTLTGGTPITYQLKDGVYQKGTDPAGASYASIKLLDMIRLGDLNGDGAGDAVALVAENYGGTGTFVSLVAFVNEKGQAVQKAIAPIDDRALIQALELFDGIVSLDAVIHGLQDPMCCPSLSTKRHYRLVDSRLVMTDFSTQVLTGDWRTITITSPELVEKGASNVKISGTVSIAPFENTLSYHIVDLQGNELAAGPFMVTAMDMGTPGTFEVEVPLDHVPPGTTAWVEIRDMSAADGSLLGMDSIEVRE